MVSRTSLAGSYGKMWSCSVAEGGLKFTAILLAQPPGC